MSLTGYIHIILLILFIITVKIVIDGIKARNWKKAIISIVIFLTIVLSVYYVLITLITSM